MSQSDIGSTELLEEAENILEHEQVCDDHEEIKEYDRKGQFGRIIVGWSIHCNHGGQSRSPSIVTLILLNNGP